MIYKELSYKNEINPKLRFTNKYLYNCYELYKKYYTKWK